MCCVAEPLPYPDVQCTDYKTRIKFIISASQHGLQFLFNCFVHFCMIVCKQERTTQLRIQLRYDSILIHDVHRIYWLVLVAALIPYRTTPNIFKFVIYSKFNVIASVNGN